MIRDLTGVRFGRLVAFERINKRAADGSAIWNCHCDCGRNHMSNTAHLVSERTRSCGCLRNEMAASRARTHGATTRDRQHTRAYIAWAAMKYRCENPKSSGFERYGGRGIHVCERWHSFEHFRDDMGECQPGLTIERIENNRGYEPGNCRWATPAEQARNTRRTRLLTHGGITMCMLDWATRTGIKWATIRARLERGWSVDHTLTVPVRRHTATSSH